MKIPPDTNTRAEAMWRIISQRVDFRGKRVIDLGCGTGDFLWRAYVAGAKQICGIDKNIRVAIARLEYAEEIVRPFSTLHSDRTLWQADIDSVVNTPAKGFDIDIIICFSVLPYLRFINGTIRWLALTGATCLIECQYNGDGPGLTQIGADKGMMQLLLSNGFDSVEPLGRTYPEDRMFPNGEPVYRTIWLCETKTKE